MIMLLTLEKVHSWQLNLCFANLPFTVIQEVLILSHVNTRFAYLSMNSL